MVLTSLVSEDLMGAAEPSLIAKLQAGWPSRAWSDMTVLVALSGGADSVALFRALAALRSSGEGRLVAAHYNHRLRGDDSNSDQVFVEELSKEVGCEVIVGVAEHANHFVSEADAREARYQFLAAAAAKFGARYIATAHTADDQAETVLHNILRGTGLAGLAGIPRLRLIDEAATLIRPLLTVTRAEVLSYLASIGQNFRQDSSNLKEDYTRNRIRRQLLPLLERDYNTSVGDSLRRLAQIAGQANEFVNREAAELVKAAVRYSPGCVEISLASAAAAPPILLRQALVQIWQRQSWPLADMSLEKWEQILALLSGDQHPPAISLPGGITAKRSQDHLHLTRDRREPVSELAPARHP